MGAALCRTLKIYKSNDKYLSLAPDSLQSLTCDWDVTRPNEILGGMVAPVVIATTPSPFTKLTALTRLELINSESIVSPEMLQELPLTELLLHNCCLSTYSKLSRAFVPGSLTALQKLHITEGEGADADAEDEIQFYSKTLLADIVREEREEARLQRRRLEAAPHIGLLKVMGEELLSKPRLQQLCGCSVLFDFGMEDELKDWRMSLGVDKSFVDSCTLPGTWLKTWSKA